MAKPGSVLDQQTEIACRVWFVPQWDVLVQLAATAPAHYGPMVAESRAKMRRALIAARKAGLASSP